MRSRLVLSLSAVVAIVLASPSLPVAASPAASASVPAAARDVLPADDGWAAATSGTTGGAAADDAAVRGRW